MQAETRLRSEMDGHVIDREEIPMGGGWHVAGKRQPRSLRRAGTVARKKAGCKTGDALKRPGRRRRRPS